MLYFFRDIVWFLEIKEKWDRCCKIFICLLMLYKLFDLKVVILRVIMERENKLNFLGCEGLIIGRLECLLGVIIFLNYWVFEEEESLG